MKKFLIFLLVLIVIILIAIPILLWPTKSIHLKQDVMANTINYLDMINVREASVDWQDRKVSISVPITVDDSTLNQLLLENFSVPSMQVDGSKITIENQTIDMTVQISKDGNFATQLNMTLTPMVQDGKLYLTVERCRWGRIPVPKSILDHYLPPSYYNSNVNAFVVSLPEEYHVIVNEVTESEGKLILTISSGQLDLSSPGALWSQLINR